MRCRYTVTGTARQIAFFLQQAIKKTPKHLFTYCFGANKIMSLCMVFNRGIKIVIIKQNHDFSLFPFRRFLLYISIKIIFCNIQFILKQLKKRLIGSAIPE